MAGVLVKHVERSEQPEILMAGASRSGHGNSQMWLTAQQAHETTAQKAFDALSATMGPNSTSTTTASSVYKATERRASVRRMNLTRRHGLMRFAVELRQIAATAGRRAGEIPTNGDTLLKLEDAANEETVERIKDKHFEEDYSIFQKLEELQRISSI